MHPFAEDWAARGQYLDGPLGRLFVVDEPPAADADGPPLLLHGFPTCSFDWRHVWSDLCRHRRTVALDLPGYGLSDKPDVRHGMEEAADAVAAVAEQLGLGEVDLVTHDMGDTVGGVLLARDLEGGLPFGVRRRVLTNGSIYIHMAGLRWQQKLLLAARPLPAVRPGTALRWLHGVGHFPMTEAPDAFAGAVVAALG